MLFVCLAVDQILNPANRQRMSLEEQLKELLEKLDMSSAMKSSPSRSKRLKLLKKTITDVRSEIYLKTRHPAAAPSEPKPAETEEKPLPPTRHSTQEEGMYQVV